jgi:transcription-repair coupling factor (superfamily II helicase)
MYLQRLAEAVHELKGEPLPLEVRTSVSLGLDLRIPSEYIGEEHQRLRAYKRIAETAGREQAEDVLAELADRYGPPPDAVRNLLEFSILKSRAERMGIESIERRHGVVNLKFHPESRVDPERLMDLVRRRAGAQFTPAGVLRLPMDGAGAPELLGNLRECLDWLAAK